MIRLLERGRGGRVFGKFLKIGCRLGVIYDCRVEYNRQITRKAQLKGRRN